MTTKVHSYLGGLGIDATNKLTLASNATVTIGNGTSTGNVHVGKNIVVGGFIGATNIPLTLGEAGQVLKVNDAANAGEWGDLEAGVGYQNSSTSVVPGTDNTDLGNLTDASQDAFGIVSIAKYDLMDPIGPLVSLDLGAL